MTAPPGERSTRAKYVHLEEIARGARHALSDLGPARAWSSPFPWKTCVPFGIPELFLSGGMPFFRGDA